MPREDAPKMELTEFAVNIPLADEFFHFDESTKSRIAEEPVMGAVESARALLREAAATGLPCAPILNVGPNTIYKSGGTYLAYWYALRIPPTPCGPCFLAAFAPACSSRRSSRLAVESDDGLVPGTLSGRSDAAARMHLTSLSLPNDGIRRWSCPPTESHWAAAKFASRSARPDQRRHMQ